METENGNLKIESVSCDNLVGRIFKKGTMDFVIEKTKDMYIYHGEGGNLWSYHIAANLFLCGCLNLIEFRSNNIKNILFHSFLIKTPFIMQKQPNVLSFG